MKLEVIAKAPLNTPTMRFSVYENKKRKRRDAESLERVSLGFSNSMNRA